MIFMFSLAGRVYLCWPQADLSAAARPEWRRAQAQHSRRGHLALLALQGRPRRCHTPE